jgi:hypothetical protein
MPNPVVLLGDFILPQNTHPRSFSLRNPVRIAAYHVNSTPENSTIFLLLL